MTSTTIERQTPKLGGFSTTLVGLEMRRMFRNRRTMIFTFILPLAMFLLFGTDSTYKNTQAGNVTAYIMISMDPG